MALIRFLVLCLVIINISCSMAEEDIKPTSRIFFGNICSEDNIINPSNSKIICLICKKFDPSCLSPQTSTTPKIEDPGSSSNSTTTVAPTSK